MVGSGGEQQGCCIVTLAGGVWVCSLLLLTECLYCSGLLEIDPRKRLGCRNEDDPLADVKAHPWFRGMNWDKLIRKEVDPSTNLKFPS